MIWQDLKAIKKRMERGEPAGLTVVEPKGDLAHDVAEMARDLGLKVTLIDPTDEHLPHFNPLEGRN